MTNTIDRKYYHYKIDFYNTDNTEILNTKYYLTSKDIKNDLGIGQKTIYNHIYNQVNKSKKYRNLDIHKIREPVIKDDIKSCLKNSMLKDDILKDDYTRTLLNIVKKGYEDNKQLSCNK
jgi:hypothetical protein